MGHPPHEDYETIPPKHQKLGRGTRPHLFATKREKDVNCGANEIGLTAITTEGDEMRLSGIVKPPQTAWHEPNLHLYGCPAQSAQVSPKEGRTRGTRRC